MREFTLLQVLLVQEFTVLFRPAVKENGQGTHMELFIWKGK